MELDGRRRIAILVLGLLAIAALVVLMMPYSVRVGASARSFQVGCVVPIQYYVLSSENWWKARRGQPNEQYFMAEAEALCGAEGRRRTVIAGGLLAAGLLGFIVVGAANKSDVKPGKGGVPMGDLIK